MGKEGNQASSFADFAIGRFKFLRRLLFWHGANFGFMITQFMCMILSKAILSSSCKLYYNIQAAYSASDFVDDLFFVSYSTVLT